MTAMSSPRIFVSATSGDLRSARQVVKEALLTINCHPVEQTNFQPDFRTVGQMLREKIQGCQALVHLAGMRYGAEPDPKTLPEGMTRRSYTQMEYDIAKELGLRVYTFVVPEGFPYDVPVDGDGQPMGPEDETKATLQRQHRQNLLNGEHIYELPNNELQLRTRILALQEKVIGLEQEQAGVRDEVKRSRHAGLKAFVAIALLLLMVGGGVAWLMQRQEVLVAATKMDATALRARLTEASERTRDTELAEAEKAPKLADRERLGEVARQAHEVRVTRIQDLASRLAELANDGDTSPHLQKMTRALEEEGVDAALAYIDKRRQEVLAEIREVRALESQRTRQKLQPLLKAAELEASKGANEAARQHYREVVELEPQWPEALEAYAWFLYDQSQKSLLNGSVKDAVADAEEQLALAKKRHGVKPEDLLGQRVLAVAHCQVADVLLIRAGTGDAERVWQHLQEGLTLVEKLHQAQPDSSRARRDFSINLNRLGDFLMKRGQAGDRDKALEYYTRDLEMSEAEQKAHPESEQAGRDVAIGLDRLGEFMLGRGQEGDVDKALGYYERSLETVEKLLKAKPDSQDAANDVAVILNKVGDVRYRRNQGDDEKLALGLYERSLALREKLLKEQPKSRDVARSVAASLSKTGNLLVTRAQGDDLARALPMYERSLSITEELYKANPDSGQAARDLAVNVERLADLLAKRNAPGDAEKAQVLYQRDLELCENLLKANPDSAAAVKDVVITHFKVALWLTQQGKDASANYKACYDLLHPRIQKGMTFEPVIVRLYELSQKFAGQP